MADISVLAPFIFSWEGGYANHPNDPGGATNKGVTIATWKAQGYDKDGDGDIDVADLKLLTDDDVLKVVLKPHFWNRWKADQIRSQSVANICVDWVWGSGKYGITNVQKLLGVTTDGIVGAKTIAAINAREPRQLFAAIKKARVQYIEALCRRRKSSAVFKAGWLRRLNSINYGSITLNTASNNVLKFADV